MNKNLKFLEKEDIYLTIEEKLNVMKKIVEKSFHKV
jgi:hypothetical protein